MAPNCSINSCVNSADPAIIDIRDRGYCRECYQLVQAGLALLHRSIREAGLNPNDILTGDEALTKVREQVAAFRAETDLNTPTPPATPSAKLPDWLFVREELSAFGTVITGISIFDSLRIESEAHTWR